MSKDIGSTEITTEALAISVSTIRTKVNKMVSVNNQELRNDMVEANAKVYEAIT